MLVRYMIAQGVRPQAVVFNVNMKEMNPADSAYRRLRPALEAVAAPLIDQEDRAQLQFSQANSFEARLDRFVAEHWLFYAERVDLRELILRHEDLGALLTTTVESWTGATARTEANHRPTSDRFFGTYDVMPLDDSNIAFHRLREALEELRARHIPAVVFVSPTNHGLLHQYIDTPDYTDNVVAVVALCRRIGARVVDLDSAVPQSDFLDNDHLTRQGNIALARALLPTIRVAR
ncbi:MAG: hypothetical protein ACYC8W_03450 [Candidatus Tyrphobacter sp.]